MFTIQKNEPLNLNLRRLNDKPLENGWLYNWYATRSGDLNDRSFYSIEGVTKEQESNFWSLQPSAVFRFNQFLPYEDVTVYAKIQIIKDNSLICISKPIGKVIITESLNDLGLCENITRVSDCVYFGEYVEYSICCDELSELDAIEFAGTGGKLFDTNLNPQGDFYAVPLNNTNCATIFVKWDDYEESYWELRARGRKGEGENLQYTNVVSFKETNVYNSTNNMEVEFDDNILYYNGEDRNINITINNLYNYPSNFNLNLFYRYMDRDTDGIETSWSAWTEIENDTILDLISIGNIIDGVYTKSILIDASNSDFENLEKRFFEIKYELGDGGCSISDTDDLILDVYNCDLNVPHNTPICKLSYECPDDTPIFGDVEINVIDLSTISCPEDEPTLGGETYSPNTEIHCFEIEAETSNLDTPIHCFEIEAETSNLDSPIHCFEIEAETSNLDTPIHCFEIEAVTNNLNSESTSFDDSEFIIEYLSNPIYYIIDSDKAYMQNVAGVSGSTSSEELTIYHLFLENQSFGEILNMDFIQFYNTGYEEVITGDFVVRIRKSENNLLDNSSINFNVPDELNLLDKTFNLILTKTDNSQTIYNENSSGVTLTFEMMPFPDPLFYSSQIRITGLTGATINNCNFNIQIYK